MLMTELPISVIYVSENDKKKMGNHNIKERSENQPVFKDVSQNDMIMNLFIYIV